MTLRPRADEAPLHRALARQEGARDLGHREPGDAAQRQRHARLGGERRVAAHEEHPELVVVHRRALEVVRGVVAHGFHQVGRVGRGDAIVAQAVERLTPRGRGQPGARTVRYAAAIPLDRRCDEGVLDDVLGEREVAVQPPRDVGQHGGALVAIRPLERAGRCAHVSSSTIGRTSTEPYSADGIFAAQLVAASRSGTEIT